MRIIYGTTMGKECPHSSWAKDKTPMLLLLLLPHVAQQCCCRVSSIRGMQTASCRDDAVQKLQNHAICGHFECNQQNCLIYDHLQFALIFQITKGRGWSWGLGQRPTKPDSTQKLIIAERQAESQKIDITDTETRRKQAWRMGPKESLQSITKIDFRP